jgi:hypothetical protein
MSDIPRLIFDGGDALAHLRRTERSAPLHMRPEHDGESLKAWFRDRREELTIEQRQWFETALYAIERGVASIKLRGHAKAGELRAVE